MGKKAQETDNLRKDTGRVQQAQNGNTSNGLQKHIRKIKKKVMYMPNTIQTMLTPRNYLTLSNKSYLQNHNGSGGTKKQMKDSNKTGFSPPT
jgi:hypothetical protein